jgi:regulator of chromosome condensation
MYAIDVAKPRKAVFMFGNGDMGQLGLGPDTLDEIPRPRIHAWYV